MPHAPFQKKRPTILATSVAALLSLGMLLGAPRASADEYWDGTTTIGSTIPNGKGGDGIGGDGIGIWDMSTTNWVDAKGNNPTTYKSNQSAVFSNFGGLVALGTNIAFTALTFDADNYVILSPGFTLAPTGAATITVAQGDRVNIGNNPSTGNQTDNPPIVGNGSITVNGPGTLILNGANWYTGGTTLASGTLIINNSNALGTGPLNITGAATIGTQSNAVRLPDLSSGMEFANPISFQTTQPLTFHNGSTFPTLLIDGLVDLNGITRTISGDVVKEQIEFGFLGIGGAGDPAGLTFTTSVNGVGKPSGVGNYVAFIMSADNINHYTGLTTVENTAFLVLQSNIAGGSIKGNVLIRDNGVVDYDLVGGASAQFNNPNATIWVFSPGDTASGTPFAGFDMFQSTADTIGTLSDDPTTLPTGANPNNDLKAGTGTVSLAGATLTIGNGNFQGQISNGGISGFSGGGLIKATTGTLTLGGMNNYTGSTVISGGTLQAAADNTFSPNSAITINTGATLDLNGFNETVASISDSASASSTTGFGAITLGKGVLTTGADNTTTTFSGIISDNSLKGGLTKIGTGTLTLAGSNSYTGKTTVYDGTLLVTGGLSSSSSLVLGGGTFSFAPTTPGTTQTLNGLTVSQGSSAIRVTSNGTVNVGGITRNAGGVVDFGTPGTVQTSFAGDGTGILGAWATVNSGGALAENDGSGNIIVYNAYTSLGAQGDTLLDGSGNVQINTPQGPGSGNTVIGSPTTTINTLSQSLSGTDATIDTSPGVLRVGLVGGIFITPNSGNLTIGTSPGSGSLTAGGGSAGTAGELILANFSNNGSVLKINSMITDNSGGAVSVTVAGSGTTELATANSYTGQTVVTSGTLQTDSANSISTSSLVVVTGGTLNLNGVSQSLAAISDGGSHAGTINLGFATLTLGGGSTNSTFAGTITDGGAGGSIDWSGTGTQTLTLSNPGNSYSGGTILNSGTLIVNGSAKDGSGTPLGTGTLTINGGTLRTTIQPGNYATGTTLLNPVVVNGSFSISTNSNTVDPLTQNFTLNGSITLGSSSTTITGLTAGSTIHLGGVISDSGGGVTFATSSAVQTDPNNPYVKFIYQGTSANTYTGLTTVGQGAVLVLNAVAPATSISNATPVVSVPGDLKIAAGGVAFLATSSQFAATSNVEVDSTGNTIAGAVLDGLELAGTSQTIQNLSGAGKVGLGSGTLTVTVPVNTSTTFSGVIEDGTFGTGGSLTQSGSGTLVLSGLNTYTGVTTITGGIIQAGVGVDNAIGKTSALVIGEKGTFDLNGTNQTIGALTDAGTGSTGTVLLGSNPNAVLTIGNTTNPSALSTTFSGSITGAGGLTKVGAGSLDLTGNGNTYTGPTTVSGGTLEVDGTITSAVTVKTGGTFDLGTKGVVNTPSGSTAVTLTAGGTFNNFGQLSVTGPGSTAVSVPQGSGGGVMINNEPGALISGDTNSNLTGSSTAISVGNTSGIVEIFNQGTITAGAGGAAINAQGSAGVTLYNFGTINGAVLFGKGNFTNVIATGMPPVPITGNGGNSTLRAAGGSAGEFSLSDFPGFGSLMKVGGGLFTLTGSGSFPLGTTIQDGTINLEGTLTSNVLNQLNGTLTGDGTIIGNVVSFGAVMPGFALGGVVNPTTALGTLHIQGNYTQEPQGQLVIQVGGNQPGSYDSLIVGGHASLAGTLELQQLGKGPQLGLGKSIPILLAPGGVTGKFGAIYNSLTSNTAVIPTLVYEPNAVVIEGTQGSFQALQHVVSFTSNENAVAVMLDRVSADNRVFPLVNYLDGQNVRKLPADFDKIAPEGVSSVYRLGVSLSDVQSNGVQRRASDLRAGISGFTAAGFQTTGGPAGDTGLAGPNGDEGKITTAAPVNRNWGAFITGVGDFIHVGNTENARGYNLDTGGFTLGADYKFNDNFAVGVMGGYTGTDSKLPDTSHLAVNGGKLGVYATYWESGFYGDILASGGYNNYEIRRTALEGDAHGTTQGGQADALVATGYDWRIDALTIGPTASFEYTYLGMSGYDERGSLVPLRYPTQHNESLRFTIGVKATYDLQVGSVIVRPEAQLAWQHEAGPSTATIDASLVSGPGTLFSASDADVGRDSLLMGGGVSVLWNPRTSTYLYYDADLFRREYYSQSVTGGLRMNF